MLTEAINAVARGWYIFPVNPCGSVNDAGSPIDKMPHLLRPGEPYTIKWGTAATNDIAKVIRYWTWSPNANIGVACGPSNLFVVDCDMPKREYQLKGTQFEYLHDELGPLVDGTDVYRALCEKIGIPWDVANNTYRVCTGSMGCHYYYRWPDGIQASQASVVKGIVDVRGNGGQLGGYVLGASSVTAKGSYVAENALPVAPAPAPLVELCTEGARTRDAEAVSAFTRAGGGGGTLSGLETAVLTAPDGNRNNALLWAARAACNDRIPEQQAVDVLGAAYVANGGDGGMRQAESTIRSAYRLQAAKMPT